MPFKSWKQYRWMWANKPKQAKEWLKKYGKPKGKKGEKNKKKNK